MLAGPARTGRGLERHVMNEIKSLLWHLDAQSARGRRLPFVREFARRLGAKAEVLYAVMPLPLQFPFAMSLESGAAGQLAASEAEARRAARQHFERACAAADCTELPWRETVDEPVRGLCQAAWSTDLLVLSQHDPTAEDPSGVAADFVASVLVSSGKPGLVLPYIDFAPDIGRQVLVAWKATRESARALGAALPLLQRAQRVHVVSWNELDAPEDDATLPAMRFLHHHGVVAHAHAQPGKPPRELGESLLTLAADLQADLMVMGCYGHGRAREWALGGATRTVLRAMTVPVLMVH
ncbi:MAG: universal stress protein UspA [Leptothrix sp. (in: Bacteria)]|nr:universal stress protein UspA [Leptothrix sp. (in: b-proteobacteria)]